MSHFHHPVQRAPFNPMSRRGVRSRVRWVTAASAFVVALALSGCGTSPASEAASHDIGTDEQGSTSEPAAATDDEPDSDSVGEQEETCDWDAARISGPAEVPAAQEGELAKVIVGSWQHTHTDDGSGFEEVVNDHRYVFPSPDRMLYCQHVPGATEHEENAVNVVLNGTTIELPGGEYSYTVTAWNEDTLVLDNPVGGGYVYLLQRR